MCIENESTGKYLCSHAPYTRFTSVFNLTGGSNREKKCPKARSDDSSNVAKPILESFSKLNDVEIKRLQNLFNIAYFLAKEKKPFGDMEAQCELAKKLGVDVGQNYHNENWASKFICVIGDTLLHEISEIIRASNFVSILADGSTDVSVLKQEVVYLRYIHNGLAKTTMIGIVNLDHGHAEGVFQVLYGNLSIFI